MTGGAQDDVVGETFRIKHMMGVPMLLPARGTSHASSPAHAGRTLLDLLKSLYSRDSPLMKMIIRTLLPIAWSEGVDAEHSPRCFL